jgi:hypothetical protein
MLKRALLFVIMFSIALLISRSFGIYRCMYSDGPGELVPIETVASAFVWPVFMFLHGAATLAFRPASRLAHITFVILAFLAPYGSAILLEISLNLSEFCGLIEYGGTPENWSPSHFAFPLSPICFWLGALLSAARQHWVRSSN